MAIVTTDDKHYKNIADAIREQLGLFEDEVFLPEDMATQVEAVAKNNYDAGYGEGYRYGREDAEMEGADSWQEGYYSGYEDGYGEGYEESQRDISDLNTKLDKTVNGVNTDRSLEENINQATSDFQDIKGKIIEKGVAIPDGTPTTDYAPKIDEVYDKGLTEGIEQGKQDERIAFWNILQNNGGTSNYYYAFAYGRFTDDNYNPQHPIRCSNGTTPCQCMFLNAQITDTKVAIYANSNNLNQAFNGASKVHTIRLLSVHASTKYTNTFDGAVALANIVIEGTIGQSISFGQCPKLTKTSITSIMTHISTTATLTATFFKSAVDKAFETSEGANDGSTSDEWKALVAAVPNATIVLA